MSDDEAEAMVASVEDQATEETLNGHSELVLEDGESIRVGTTASARFNVLSTVRLSCHLRLERGITDRDAGEKQRMALERI